jgi:hypothetical protein
MDRLIKNRQPHHLGGAHRRGALYSAHRAPCEKPMERRVLARRGGRVKCSFGLSRFATVFMNTPG